VKRPWLFAIIFSIPVIPVFGQTAPEPAERTAYVRRFSVTARISVLPLKPVSESTVRENLTVGPTEVSTTSESLANRVGGGIGLQLALSDRFAVNADLLYRKLGYRNTTELRTGVDNPNTTDDDRTLRTIINETETGAWELPVVLRRYSRSRFEDGPLWFFEAGGAVRRARKATAFSENDGEFSQVSPNVSRRYRPGVVAGFGVHLTDDFGIRIIPEVRYTYWFSRTIDDRPARSAAHQAEVLIGISF